MSGPRTRIRSQQLYVDHLSFHGYGYPIFYPGLHNNDPSNEVKIGQVGHIGRLGEWIPLFNLFEGKDEGLNHSAFQHRAPVDFQRWDSTLPDFETYRQEPVPCRVTSQHVVVKGGSAGVESGFAAVQASLSIDSQRQSGAALFMPEEGRCTSLVSLLSAKDGFLRERKNWLQYANDIRKRGIGYTDLALVVGEAKASHWAVAAFGQHTLSGNLTFGAGALGTSASVGVWGQWSSSGGVWAHSGPQCRCSKTNLITSASNTSSPEIEQTPACPDNQCIFMQRLRIRPTIRHPWMKCKLEGGAGPADNIVQLQNILDADPTLGVMTFDDLQGDVEDEYECILYISGVEYGRGCSTSRNSAREVAAAEALTRIRESLFSPHLNSSSPDNGCHDRLEPDSSSHSNSDLDSTSSSPIFATDDPPKMRDPLDILLRYICEQHAKDEDVEVAIASDEEVSMILRGWSDENDVEDIIRKTAPPTCVVDGVAMLDLAGFSASQATDGRNASRSATSTKSDTDVMDHRIKSSNSTTAEEETFDLLTRQPTNDAMVEADANPQAILDLLADDCDPEDLQVNPKQCQCEQSTQCAGACLDSSEERTYSFSQAEIDTEGRAESLSDQTPPENLRSSTNDPDAELMASLPFEPQLADSMQMNFPHSMISQLEFEDTVSVTQGDSYYPPSPRPGNSDTPPYWFPSALDMWKSGGPIRHMGHHRWPMLQGSASAAEYSPSSSEDSSSIGSGGTRGAGSEDSVSSEYSSSLSSGSTRGSSRGRSHEHHPSRGSSTRFSPYPSPNISPASRLPISVLLNPSQMYGLPSLSSLPSIHSMGGMGLSMNPSTLDNGHGNGSGPGTPGADSTPVGHSKVAQNITTDATAEASVRRRKGEASFKCPVPGCSSTFTRHFNLKGHMRSHNEEKPFTCKWPGCGKGFARQHDCKRHEQLHLNIRPYACEGCKKNFARMDALNRHLRSEGGLECKRVQPELTVELVAEQVREAEAEAAAKMGEQSGGWRGQKLKDVEEAEWGTRMML